jgi:trafficking protein particle complex subunit 13
MTSMANDFSIQAVTLTTNPILRSSSLNWDNIALPSSSDHNTPHNPILNPRDVVQVAFVLEKLPKDDTKDIPDEAFAHVPKLPSGDHRIALGQLSIQWRSTMGERGSLKTAWLSSRR